MTSSFRKRFLRDLKKIRADDVLAGVKRAILAVEQADGPDAIPDLKKISGGENSYRIRVGDYRIGVVPEGDRVDFVRCLHRRDIYKFFP